MNNLSQEKYTIIFEGLNDDSPQTLQKLKGIFIADLELPIEEVKRILVEYPSEIYHSNSKQRALIITQAIEKAGGKAKLIDPNLSDRDKLDINPPKVFELSLETEKEPEVSASLKQNPIKEALQDDSLTLGPAEALVTQKIPDLAFDFEDAPLPEVKKAPVETVKEVIKEDPLALKMAIDQENHDPAPVLSDVTAPQASSPAPQESEKLSEIAIPPSAQTDNQMILNNEVVHPHTTPQIGQLADTTTPLVAAEDLEIPPRSSVIEQSLTLSKKELLMPIIFGALLLFFGNFIYSKISGTEETPLFNPQMDNLDRFQQKKKKEKAPSKNIEKSRTKLLFSHVTGEDITADIRAYLVEWQDGSKTLLIEQLTFETNPPPELTPEQIVKNEKRAPWLFKFSLGESLTLPLSKDKDQNVIADFKAGIEYNSQRLRTISKVKIAVEVINDNNQESYKIRFFVDEENVGVNTSSINALAARVSQETQFAASGGVELILKQSSK
jgi:hypothetical protein